MSTIFLTYSFCCHWAFVLADDITAVSTIIQHPLSRSLRIETSSFYLSSVTDCYLFSDKLTGYYINKSTLFY